MRATDTRPQRLARQHRAGPQRNCDDHDWAHRISIRSPENAPTPQAKRIPNEPYALRMSGDWRYSAWRASALPSAP